MAQIRHIRDEEIAARVALQAEAFGFPPSPDAEQRYRDEHDLEWTFGAFEGERLVAALHVQPLRVRFGNDMAMMGGVGGVGALPEVRRQGHVGRLLLAALAQMRERGLAISMLFPTFYALYRRYGWEVGASDHVYRFDSHDLRDADLPATGSFERMNTDGWRTLDGLYRAAPPRNGMLERDETWWRQRVLSGRDSQQRDIVLWRDDAGEPGGYVVYSRSGGQWLFQGERGVTQLAGHELMVRELVAVADGSYLQLLRFLAGHDLARRILWTAPADDPLPFVVPDPRALATEVRRSFMVRIVDVAGALAARGAPPGAGPLAFTLAVRDPRCTWNEGTWQVETDAAGACAVERADGEPDLEVDAGTLAALLIGSLDLAEAQALGRARVRAGAAAAIVSFVAMGRAPHCSDFF